MNIHRHHFRTRVIISIVFAMMTTVAWGQGRSVQDVSACKIDETTKARHTMLIPTLVPSPFKTALQLGRFYCGVHLPWMDEMKDLHVKQAYFSFVFKRVGTSGTLELKSVDYLAAYYDFDRPVSSEIKEKIIDSGLASKLRIVAESHIADIIPASLRKNAYKCGEFDYSILDDETLPWPQNTYETDFPKCGSK